MKLLILDNYDSFTYNLVHLIEKVSAIDFEVHRNDAISIDAVNNFDKILLSPGPGLPSQAGIMPELIKKYGSKKSILGVCLGMQAIGEAYGGTLKNLDNVCHGQAMPIHITEPSVLFTGCPKSFIVGRYHSWVISEQKFPKELQITALDDSQHIMALRHREYDIQAVQFHPESILSEYGEEIIRNWLTK